MFENNYFCYWKRFAAFQPFVIHFRLYRIDVVACVKLYPKAQRSHSLQLIANVTSATIYCDELLWASNSEIQSAFYFVYVLCMTEKCRVAFGS